jgi:Tol biopolymer transport system component
MIPEAETPIAIGTKIGPYDVLGWLGTGGMGVVYRARDPRLGRDVAIKVMSERFASDPTRLQRFEQEARAAGQLNHPNVLAVYDIGVHGGAPYIVSELLEGESLRSHLRSGRLSTRKAIDYARQIAEGLAAAHDRQIVHRDVKPDNLFITNDGRVKILDFGIAKLTQPSAEGGGHTGVPTQTEAGTVIGTAGYMSPEQVRGDTVDARSDLFSFGAVLYEMLAGHTAFVRETVPETLTAILKSDPLALHGDVPPALARIVSRCLEKTREMRFQSARDLGFGLEMISDTIPAIVPMAAKVKTAHRRIAAAVTIVALVALGAVAARLTRDGDTSIDRRFANATFSRVTNWPGTEGAAEISPDGRFVAFLADKDGDVDLWLTQIGTSNSVNLTKDSGSLGAFRSSALIRRLGFTGDGSEIWSNFSGADRARKMLIPLTGGVPRPFLTDNANGVSWSPDNGRIVYFEDSPGDPLFVAEATGGNARPLHLSPPPPDEPGIHQHNPAWATDGQWIYFLRGSNPTIVMDIWRVRPSGQSAEQLTHHNAAVTLLAPIDPRTVLYVARSDDRTGPWLWALDTVTKATHRVTSGLEQYASVSASRDGRRLVATVANPTATLWRVPLMDREAGERDVTQHVVATDRALAPRFGGTALFFLSARGTGDGLWRYQGGEASEVWKGVNGALTEPAAVSRDGRRVAIIVRRDGKGQLTVMSADGTSPRRLAEGIDIQGAADQASADWSPNGEWIVVGGVDAQGEGLFKVPANGGAPVRLVTGRAVNPAWSPDGKLIVYGGAFIAGQAELRGVRPDGSADDLPPPRTLQGGYRFLPRGNALVYVPTLVSLDFWLLDLETKTTRQLTRLTDQGGLRTFDVTPDGKAIVFDRVRENSDIVQIDLPK